MFTDSVPVAPTLTVVIDLSKIRVRYKSRECNCSKGAKLEYGEFSHTTYTMAGYAIYIQEVFGWKCTRCSLVILISEIDQPLRQAIKEAISEHESAD